MTIQNQNKRIAHAGNDSTVAFAYNFRIQDEDDLTVVLQSTAGVDTTQTITTHYTVANVGVAGGGTITMVTAPATGETLTIVIDPDLTQLTDYSTGGSFPAQSHEDALDKLLNIAKRTRDVTDRSLTLPDGDTAGSGSYQAGGNKIEDLGTPTAATDAATMAYADAAVAAAVLDPTTPVSAFAATLLDDADSNAFLATLQYEQGGANDVPYAMRERLQNELWVTDFGATGDGVTDDTDAINFAIVAANAAGGGVVRFPAGDFLLSDQGSSIAISMLPDVWLMGAGAGATKLTLDDAQDCHVINAESPNNSRIMISDLEIDGNAANQTVEVHGIRVDDGAQDVRFFRLYVHDTYHYGIGFEGGVTAGDRVWLDSLYLKDIGADGIDIKDVQTDSRGYMISNIFVDNPGAIDTSGAGGIDVRGTASLVNIQVINLNHASVVNAGINLRDAAAASPNEQHAYNTTVTNFTISGTGLNTRGIALSGEHCRVSNGVIEVTGANARGISMDTITLGSGAIENVVEGVTIFSPGDAAIIMASDNCRRNIIQNCKIYDTGSNGIRVSGGEDNIVQNNEIVNPNGSCITVEALAQRTVVRGNTCRTASTAGIEISATALETVIQANSYEGCTANLTDAGTDTVLVGDAEFGITKPVSVASATVLPVPYPEEYLVVTGTTNVTSISAADSIQGRRVTLRFVVTCTVSDGNNLKLATDFVSSAADTLTLVCDGTDWYEVSRSAN